LPGRALTESRQPLHVAHTEQGFVWSRSVRYALLARQIAIRRTAASITASRVAPQLLGGGPEEQ
jgi:hypothetical protein